MTPGFFETMRYHRGSIPLWAAHRQRLKRSFDAVGVPLHRPHLQDVYAAICAACERGTEAKRVRLNVSFLDEATESPYRLSFVLAALPEGYAHWKGDGWRVGSLPERLTLPTYVQGIKSTDRTAYDRAAAYGRAQGWEECLLHNPIGGIADGWRSNLFIIEGDTVTTPPLSEGCVAGVMRGWLLDNQPGDFRWMEAPLQEGRLVHADEIFLTNALFGIRGVSRWADRLLPIALAEKLYLETASNLWP